ncbi:MAG: hypothetical protein HYV26_10845 [Candidatus Hydrogenedentes bacterium]|nr:hypothetical protein [Candidatus Hydrogenedentota bacterium]
MGSPPAKRRTIPLARHLFLAIFAVVLFMGGTLAALVHLNAIETARARAETLFNGRFAEMQARLDLVRLPVESALKRAAQALASETLSLDAPDQLRRIFVPMLEPEGSWRQLWVRETASNRGWLLEREPNGWRITLIPAAGAPAAPVVQRWASVDALIEETPAAHVVVLPIGESGEDLSAQGDAGQAVSWQVLPQLQTTGNVLAAAVYGTGQFTVGLTLDAEAFTAAVDRMGGVMESQVAALDGQVIDSEARNSALIPQPPLEVGYEHSASFPDFRALDRRGFRSVRETSGNTPVWRANTAYPQGKAAFLALLSAIQEAELLTYERNITSSAFLIGLASLVLAAFLTYWVARSYTRPIRAFIERAGHPRILDSEHAYLPHSKVRELAALNVALEAFLQEAAQRLAERRGGEVIPVLAAAPEPAVKPPSAPGRQASVAEGAPGPLDEPPQPLLLEDHAVAPGRSEAERRRLAAEKTRLAAEKMHWAVEQKRFIAEKDVLAKARLELAKEREQLAAERSTLAEEKEDLAAEMLELARQQEQHPTSDESDRSDRSDRGDDQARAALDAARESLHQDRAALHQEREAWDHSQAQILALRETLRQESAALNKEKENFTRDRARLLAREEQLESERAAIQQDWAAYQQEKQEYLQQQAKLEAAQERLAEETSELARAREAIASAEVAGDLVAERQEMQAAVAHLNARRLELENSSERLRARELAHRMEEERLDAERHALEDEKQRWMLAQAELDEERQRLAHEREDLAAQVVDLMRAREEMAGATDQLTLDRDELEDERRLFEREAGELAARETAVQVLQQRLTVLQQDLTEKEQALGKALEETVARETLLAG